MEDQLDAKEMMEEKEIITDMENLIDMEYFRNRLAEPHFVAELRMENARKKRKALDIGVVPNECESKGNDSAEAGTSSELKKKANANQLETLGEVGTVQFAELETPNVGIPYNEQDFEIEDESYPLEFGSPISDSTGIVSEERIPNDDLVARVQQWMSTTFMASDSYTTTFESSSE